MDACKAFLVNISPLIIIIFSFIIFKLYRAGKGEKRITSIFTYLLAFYVGGVCALVHDYGNMIIVIITLSLIIIFYLLILICLGLTTKILEDFIYKLFVLAIIVYCIYNIYFRIRNEKILIINYLDSIKEFDYQEFIYNLVQNDWFVGIATGIIAGIITNKISKKIKTKESVL